MGRLNHTGKQGRITLDRKEHLWFFFQFLQKAGKGISKEEEKQVMIEKAINLKLMCDYAVSCSYGDIVLIICMLHDYVKMLDELRADDIQYQAYYRKKFMNMAVRLAGQINYDYEAAVEKCRRKQWKESSSIGEDGLSQYVKYGSGMSKKKQEGESGGG